MKKLFYFLASLKDSPRLWALAAPFLLAFAVHFAPGRMWWVPIAVYAIEDWIVPMAEAPQAQRIHFCIGYLCTSLVRWHHFGLAIIPVAFLIEYFYDPKYEGDPFWVGGFVDFMSYVIGALLGSV